MSLLHQALKKAEMEKEGGKGIEGEAFVDSPESPSKIGKRVIVLMALVLIGLGYLVYLRWFSEKVPSVVSVPPSLNTPLGIGSATSLPRLIQESDLHLKQGEWEKARQILEKWVVLDPQNPEAYNNLGLALKKLGQKNRAYQQYQKALALRRDYPEALNNLGALYLSDAKLIEAEINFKRAVDIRQDYAEPYFHLALIAEAQGKKGVAKGYYQKFLGLSPQVDPKLMIEIRERIESLPAS
ncbi:MAG: tetratricopeptide repeat protein [Deltaproteobacteria bacterium]|nr:tetratricopeptide repeat protein [Deltaproteobacteria bacterium]